MRTAVFLPGRVGSLSSYLTYFFLRFPGTHGPESVVEAQCFDTYDHRWQARGQVWVRTSSGFARVAPPALFPLSADAGEFGLQAPVYLGKLTLRVRTVAWEAEGRPLVEGHIVKARRRSWLVLRSDDEQRLKAFEQMFVAEGMLSASADLPSWVPSGHRFEGPQAAELEASQPAAACIATRLLDSFRVARQYEAGVLDNVDTECLHQYRVHLRRARSWCSLGIPWRGLPEWARLKDVLRRLQQETNALRDLEVLELDLPALRARLPWGEGLALEGWQTATVAQASAERARVCRWLRSADYARLCSDIVSLAGALGARGEPLTLGELTTNRFLGVARRLRKDLAALGDEPGDVQLHELRVASKRLRYVLEGLGALVPQGRHLLILLKGTQQALGDFQDRSVLLEHLKRQVAEVRSGGASVDPLAFGLLLGSLAAEHEQLKRGAVEAARVLGSKAFRQGLRYRHEP